jgi:hypothetical protein
MSAARSCNGSEMVPPNDQESGLSVRAQRRDAPLAPVSISNETMSRSPRADNDAEANAYFQPLFIRSNWSGAALIA